LQDRKVGGVGRPAGCNGAFEKGSIRRIAVVSADAEDDGAL
jgi:hypothetical protein